MAVLRSNSFLFQCGIVIFLSSKASGLAPSKQNLQQKEDSDAELMGSKFDFDFTWDDEPPEFISQLDLEVKWENDAVSTPHKVSIKNITMNNDNDITGPMTQLITTVANHSFHERRNQFTSSESPKFDVENAENVGTPGSLDGSCSCEEILSLLKHRQVLKGEPGPQGRRGRRGYKGEVGSKGEKGPPGLSIVGPKGEPGDSGLLPHHLLYPETLKGQKGEMGMSGPPGVCSASCNNPNSVREATTSTPTPANNRRSFNNKASYRIVPGALVFKTLPSMMQMSNYVMIGSVAFVEESEEFYGKVKKGWRQFQMGPILPQRDQ